MKKYKSKKKGKKGRPKKPRHSLPGKRHETAAKPKPELLAPAGSEEGFLAAVEHGADAVYFGIGSMNARAYGKNFSFPQAVAIINEAHRNHVRAFGAMNSLVQEKELYEAIKTVSVLYEAGIDALIIQDPGLWYLCRKYFPDLRLHASTLMTIHNSAGVRQANEMGFKRVVLAREMTLSEIRQAVRTGGDVEIEVFVHGAMCFTYSGLCMFSSFYGGRSSTRGRCVQPCRRRFKWNGREGAFFSMNDLNSLSLIPELIKTGVASFKIEGRLKPAGYTASIVRAYRMVMDAEGDEIEGAITEGQKIIDSAMGRQGSTGFFLSPEPKEPVSPSRTGNTGQFIGRVVKQKKNSMVIKGKISPDRGDRLRYVLPELDIQMPFTCPEVIQTETEHFEIGINSALNRKLKELKGKAIKKTGSLKPLIFRTDTYNSLFKGNRHLHIPSKDNLQAILKSAGESTELILSKERLMKDMEKNDKEKGKKTYQTGEPEIWFKTDRIDNLSFLNRIKHRGLIVETTPHNIFKKNDILLRHNKNVVWSLPAIIHEAELRQTLSMLKELLNRGQRAFMISNTGHIDLLRQLIPGKHKDISRLKLYGGRELNILNSLSIKALSAIGIRYPQISAESDCENARLIKKGNKKTFFTVYAWIPLFTSRVNHKTFNCRKHLESLRGEHYYWKRKGKTGFLLPQRPFSLINRKKKLTEGGFDAWIVDVSLWPGHIKPPGYQPSSLNAIAKFLSGSDFNFSNGLE